MDIQYGPQETTARYGCCGAAETVTGPGGHRQDVHPGQDSCCADADPADHPAHSDHGRRTADSGGHGDGQCCGRRT
jgi:hypothetical protein